MSALDWVEIVGLLLAGIDFLGLTPRLEEALDRLRALLRSFLDLSLEQPFLLVLPGLFVFVPIVFIFHEEIFTVVPRGAELPWYLAPLIGLGALACYLGTGWILALLLGCI